MTQIQQYHNLRKAEFSPSASMDIVLRRVRQNQDKQTKLLIAAEIELDRLWKKMKEFDGVDSDIGYVPTEDNPYVREFDTMMRQRGGIVRRVQG